MDTLANESDRYRDPVVSRNSTRHPPEASSGNNNNNYNNNSSDEWRAIEQQVEGMDVESMVLRGEIGELEGMDVESSDSESMRR